MALDMPSAMTYMFPNVVLKTLRRRCWLVVSALVLLSGSASAQTFNGPYAGIDASRQHIIGGSLVNGVDTLQEDSRLVVSAFAGLRVQARRFVFGGELGVGRMDGDLALEDASQSLTVNYANDSQWHWALQAGYVVGARTLVFGYLSEVTRQFDVTINQSGQTTTQQDEQGMLRFGGGIERQVWKRLNLRVTFGSSRADFGGRPTNIDIDRRLEAGAGLVIQF